MSQRKKLIGVGIVTFICLLTYFFCSYKYYPGLQLRFYGQVVRDTPAKIYWDYGQGFNEFDAIDVTLSAGPAPDTVAPLERVSIEPAGFKSENAKGYVFWLVVPQNIYDAKEFVIQGKHQWGKWLRINSTMKGRQLVLFPGSRIEFPVKANDFRFYYFKAPQAGFAKVYAQSGVATRYIDGYGTNKQLAVTPEVYKEERVGPIQSLSDPFRNRNDRAFFLPRQKIKGLLIKVQESQVKNVLSSKRLRISPSSFNSAGQGKAISIERIMVNGELVDLDSKTVKFSGQRSGQGLIFIHEDGYLELEGEITSYEIHFSKTTESKAIAVKLDNNDASVKEALAPDGHNILTGMCEKISYPPAIDKVEVSDWQGKAQSIQASGKNEIEIADQLKGFQQSQFKPILLIVQVLTAFFSALLVSLTVSACIEEKKKMPSASLFFLLFVREKRWFFWTVFLCGLLVNTLFLFAEWPGSLTPDSITILKEVRWLKFTNHHPYIYSLLTLALLNFFDAPITVIIVQMVLFHLLIGAFFYILFTKGAELRILLPCFLLAICSLPINFFNIVLWKDIPFSILVLFWALYLSYILYLRIYEKKRVYWSTGATLVLAGLFFLLCTLRHNGLVYLPFVPLILWLFFHDARKKYFLFFIVSTILLVSYFFVFPHIVLQKNNKKNDFAIEAAEKKTNGLRSVIAGKGDKYFLEDYLAERMEIFVKTLGTSPDVWIWNNDMHAPPPRWFSVDEARADMKTRPLILTLSLLEKKLLGTMDFKGIFAGRFIFWNSLFALCALIMAFMLSRWFPVSAFYSSIFLYQTVFLFIVVWPRWRYLYYLYLGGVFLIPVFLFEWSKLRLRKTVAEPLVDGC
jgi:hypothetical protein